jgi:hypothetical protein
MKQINKSAVIFALALGVSAWTLTAQDQGNPPPDGQRPPPPEGAPPGPGSPDGPGVGGNRRGPGGPEMQGEGRGPAGRQGRPGMTGQPRPVLPIIAALDLNKDGVIDAKEIAKASESLKKLDKNEDGKLTPEEFLPPPPWGQGQQGRPGMRGFGGPGGPDGRGGPGMPGEAGPRGPGGRGGPDAPGGPPPGNRQDAPPQRPPSE